MPLSSAAIILDVEQAPNPESRVTLADERDAFGNPRARLCWRLTDQDRRTAEQFTRMIAVEFARLGLGRCRLEPWLSEPGWESGFSETFHQMGTTRMASDPRRGVVDADCRMHGVANLYVAGSSVFPAVGHGNPTLTIVALALRLADRLKARLASA